MNIEKALKIKGWMLEEELEYLATLASESCSVVEIGSWNGRSSRAIADNLSYDGDLWCVDNWSDGGDGEGGGREAEREFDLHLGEFPSVCKVKMSSLGAARFFTKTCVRFDLIFIDADHSYESVKADILAWRPLLREGGVLAGHDFSDAWPGVQRAVRELIPFFGVVGTIWSTEGV
jgi:predicted O-methyltransferase YrrM